MNKAPEICCEVFSFYRNQNNVKPDARTRWTGPRFFWRVIVKLWVTGERAKTFLNLRICFLSYFYPISEPENLFLILWCILSQPVALTNSGLEGARKFEHKQCSGVWGKVVWKYKQFLNRQPWYVWQVGGGGLNMWFCKIPLFSYLFPHRVAKLHKIKNILNDACRSMGKVSKTS